MSSMRVRLKRDDEASIEGLLIPEITTAVEVARIWPEGLIGEDDADWHWPTIVRDHSGSEWSQFELQYDNRAQGLMVVKRRHELRAPANTGADGCYIEYVAAAPWNRPPTGDTRYVRVKPVGLTLVGAAIRLSIQLGFAGRLGWHSKPGAEQWYKASLDGLWPGGPDMSEGGLEYFELSAIAGQSFAMKTSALYVED